MTKQQNTNGAPAKSGRPVAAFYLLIMVTPAGVIPVQE